MNYLFLIKQIVFISLGLVLLYFIVNLISATELPKNNNIQISIKDLDIKSSNSINDVPKDFKFKNVNNAFAYKVVGARIGQSNQSVIVQDKKNKNKTYVLYVGDKLNNVYEVIEINETYVTFKSPEGNISIKNEIHK
jgi:hypothetical protein